MKELTVTSVFQICSHDELSDSDRELVATAIQYTQHSYAPYSNFKVGAALRLANGEIVCGCNQENAAFPSGICAERSAIFAAGARFPGVAVDTIAIAARGTDDCITPSPVSPCGTCRQVIIETEKRGQRPMRILLVGANEVYIVNGIAQLMPLSFTDI